MSLNNVGHPCHTTCLSLTALGRYGLVHGKLLQGLRMWRQNNPAQHAEYGAEHVLQTPHWHVEDSIAVLEAVPGYGSGSADAGAGSAAGGVAGAAGAGAEDVWRLLRTLGQGAELEVLCYGNIAREKAEGAGPGVRSERDAQRGVFCVADTYVHRNHILVLGLCHATARLCNPVLSPQTCALCSSPA